jgi:hypothetical protein
MLGMPNSAIGLLAALDREALAVKRLHGLPIQL